MGDVVGSERYFDAGSHSSLLLKPLLYCQYLRVSARGKKNSSPIKVEFKVVDKHPTGDVSLSAVMDLYQTPHVIVPDFQQVERYKYKYKIYINIRDKCLKLMLKMFFFSFFFPTRAQH